MPRRLGASSTKNLMNGSVSVRFVMFTTACKLSVRKLVVILRSDPPSICDQVL